jgi:hypothetical protein
MIAGQRGKEDEDGAMRKLWKSEAFRFVKSVSDTRFYSSGHNRGQK